MASEIRFQADVETAKVHVQFFNDGELEIEGDLTMPEINLLLTMVVGPIDARLQRERN